MAAAVAYIKDKPLVSATAAMVLKALVYADVFSYPLTAKEVFERTAANAFKTIQLALDELVADGYIFLTGEFYTLHNNPLLIQRRLQGNKKALQYLQIAKWVTALVRHFPFVRGVMLSGSVSKMYADEKSDIDYFIITAPNRLWVARLFFILCQKLVFFNRCKFFCYNYMIDEQHLTIDHKNYYTAMEIVTLVPAYSGNAYHAFLRHNKWTEVYFPNYKPYNTNHIPYRQSLVQRSLEALLSNRFGEWADKKLMTLTQRNWRRKSASKQFGNGKELELKRHTAKGHTQDHFGTIMTTFETRLQQYSEMLNIHFDAPGCKENNPLKQCL